jgi:hypothetical protein
LLTSATRNANLTDACRSNSDCGTNRESNPKGSGSGSSEPDIRSHHCSSESSNEYRRFSCSQSIASTVERSTYVRTRIGKRVKQVSDAVVALGQRDTGSGKVLFLRSDATTQSTQSLRL